MVEDGDSSLDHAFAKVCDILDFEKLKHQEEAIRQVVEMKCDVYVNLQTGYRKSVVLQALPTVFASVDKCENFLSFTDHLNLGFATLDGEEYWQAKLTNPM